MPDDNDIEVTLAAYKLSDEDVVYFAATVLDSAGSDALDGMNRKERRPYDLLYERVVAAVSKTCDGHDLDLRCIVSVLMDAVEKVVVDSMTDELAETIRKSTRETGEEE